MATTVFTAVIEKERDLYAALCPELDVASQGATVESLGEHVAGLIHKFETRWGRQYRSASSRRRARHRSLALDPSCGSGGAELQG